MRDLKAQFENLIQMIREDKRTGSSLWDAIVGRLDMGSNDFLLNTHIDEAISDTALQVTAILEHEPPSATLTFYLFGLFEAVRPNGDRDIRMYLCGGYSAEPERAVDSGSIEYLPKSRLLMIPALEEFCDVPDWIAALAAGTVIAKGIAAKLSLPQPIFVGFDNGDAIRIAN